MPERLALAGWTAGTIEVCVNGVKYLSRESLATAVKFADIPRRSKVTSLSATVDQRDDVSILLSTCGNGAGGAFWSGVVCKVARGDSGRVLTYETLADVSSMPVVFETHEGALIAALAKFDDEQDGEWTPSGDPECFWGDDENGHGMGTTGWDAADHKAMYE